MITRRSFVKAGSTLLAGTALHRRLSFGADEAGNPPRARPTPAQLAWQDCEVGLLYSFDLAIAAGIFARNNTRRERIDPVKYNPVTQLS